MNRTPVPLRPFLQLMEPHWLWMTLGVLLGIAAAWSGIGLLALSGWFISAAAAAGLSPATAKLFNFFLPSIGVRIFAMTRTAARYGERIVTHDATFRILESLRSWCYRQIEPLAPAGLARYRSGDLLNRVVADVDALDNLYVRVMTPTIIAAASAAAVVVLVSVFTLHGALWVAIALLAAGGAIPAWAGQLGRRSGRRIAAETSTFRRLIVDGHQGIAELLVYDGYPAYRMGCMASHGRLVREQRRMHHVGGMAAGLITLISGLAVLGVFLAASPLVTAGSLKGEMLALVLLAGLAAFEPMLPLYMAFQYLGQTREAARRLTQLADGSPAVTYPANGAAVVTAAGIRLEDVSFSYGEDRDQALEGVNLDVASGERVAVVGETGSGKTTLFHLMVRFWDPTRGRLSVGGVPLKDFTESTLRRQICVVSQEAHLFTASIRDNLLIAAPSASDDDLWAALSAARLADFVKTLANGLDTWVGVSGRLLSGGQARRLAVARAILKNAPIWLLDEPTEGLDTDNEHRLMEAVLAAAEKRTLIMITHRSAGLAAMDRVLLLEQGRIVEFGTHAALIQRGGRYAALFGNRTIDR